MCSMTGEVSTMNQNNTYVFHKSRKEKSEKLMMLEEGKC